MAAQRPAAARAAECRSGLHYPLEWPASHVGPTQRLVGGVDDPTVVLALALAMLGKEDVKALVYTTP